MKVEKINNTQIRCELTIEDLDAMNVNLTDLILKKDKSRALFEDILEVALIEHGFSPGDSPMMIEAVPSDDNTITLTFTIVDSSTTNPIPLNALAHLQKPTNDTDTLNETLLGHGATANSEASPNIFSFKTMDEVLDTIQVIAQYYSGNSNLHLDKSNDLFILTLYQGEMDINCYNKVCNTLCEFGVLEVCNQLSLAYLNEYCQPILLGNAVEILTQI